MFIVLDEFYEVHDVSFGVEWTMYIWIFKLEGVSNIPIYILHGRHKSLVAKGGWIFVLHSLVHCFGVEPCGLPHGPNQNVDDWVMFWE